MEIDPIPNLRKAISDLDSANKVNPDLLKISKVLNRELEDYEKTTQIYNIGKALGAKKGDLVEYFNSDKKKTGKSWTTNTNNPAAEIDISHYKQLLWNTIDEILEIAGYPIEELAKEFGVKNRKKNNNENNKKNNKKNPTNWNGDIYSYKNENNIGGD